MRQHLRNIEMRGDGNVYTVATHDEVNMLIGMSHALRRVGNLNTQKLVYWLGLSRITTYYHPAVVSCLKA